MKDMSSLLRLSLTEVDFAVKSEPQGNIAGIYNILAFKQTLHQVEGDGITRSTADQAPNYVTPRSRGQASRVEKHGDQKRKKGLKSAPTTKGTVKTTPLTPGRQFYSAQKPPTPKTTITTPLNDDKSVKKRVIPKILLSKYEKSHSCKPKQLTDFVPIKKISASADVDKRNAKLANHLLQKPIINRSLMQHPIDNVLNLEMPRISITPTTPRLHTPRPSSSLATPTVREKRSSTTQAEGNKIANPKLPTMKISEKLTPK